MNVTTANSLIPANEYIDRLQNGEEISIGSNYVLVQNQLYLIKQSKTNKIEEIFISPAIFISECYQNIQNHDAYMKINFIVNGEWISEKLPMNMYSKLNNWLASKGFLVAPDKIGELQKYLAIQQPQVMVKKQYEQVGFIENKYNELIIGLSEAVSQKPNYYSWNQKASVLDVSKKGTLEGWLEIVKQDVLGKVPLEFMLGVAASALIVGYYNRQGQDKDSLLFQLTGESTTGKTTASQLAISVFGPPIKGKNTLFQSFNGTENAIVNKLGGNYGVPFLIDELSLTSNVDLTKFIYLIAENREKARMNDQMILREYKSWSSTFIITGEQSIFKLTNRNAGLMVRLFEFKNNPWTRNKNHANRLKNGIKNHYGHAGIVYAKYLANDWKRIDRTVQEWTSYFEEGMLPDPFRGRIAEKYAMVVAGLELFGQALNIPVQSNMVAEFILDNDMKLQMKRNPADAFRSIVVQDVCSTYNQFQYENKPCHSPIIKGKIRKTKDGAHYKVNYLVPSFHDLVRDANISDFDLLIKDLKKKPYFNHERDRETYRTNVNNIREVTYEFEIPVSELDPWINIDTTL